MGVKGGIRIIFKGCNPIILVTEGRMQNFKTLAQPLLGEFGWGLLFLLLLLLLLLLPHKSKVNSQVWPGVGVWQKFTPKYIIVGLSELLLRVQSYSFCNWGPHAKFQNPSTAPSGRIWVRVLVVLPHESKVNSQILAWGGSLTKTTINVQSMYVPV